MLAERLPYLGTAVVPRLKEIAQDEQTDDATRYFAAWVGVQVGARGEFVDVLCAEAAAGTTTRSAGAATALAKYGILEGIGPVTTTLSRVDPMDTKKVITFVAALSDLSGGLPADTRQRLLEGCEPWVSDYVRQQLLLDNVTSSQDQDDT